MLTMSTLQAVGQCAHVCECVSCAHYDKYRSGRRKKKGGKKWYGREAQIALGSVGGVIG